LIQSLLKSTLKSPASLKPGLCLQASAQRTLRPSNPSARPEDKKKKKHVLSPEARKRIADAQHKRWALHKAKAKSKK